MLVNTRCPGTGPVTPGVAGRDNMKTLRRLMYPVTIVLLLMSGIFAAAGVYDKAIYFVLVVIAVVLVGSLDISSS
jgi:hypothetical protein